MEPQAAATTDPLPPHALQVAEHLDALPPVLPHSTAPLDHSGRKQKGHASYYAARFAHRKMADGRRLNPNANVAASKNLPLGTTAKITNMTNGRSATVTVQDRGPYVDGRVVDVTPKVARDLELQHDGVAPVLVKPITVPQRDGSIKLGAGAAEATPQEIHQAAKTTEALTGTSEKISAR